MRPSEVFQILVDEWVRIVTALRTREPLQAELIMLRLQRAALQAQVEGMQASLRASSDGANAIHHILDEANAPRGVLLERVHWLVHERFKGREE